MKPSFIVLHFHVCFGVFVYDCVYICIFLFIALHSVIQLVCEASADSIVVGDFVPVLGFCSVACLTRKV